LDILQTKWNEVSQRKKYGAFKLHIYIYQLFQSLHIMYHSQERNKYPECIFVPFDLCKEYYGFQFYESFLPTVTPLTIDFFINVFNEIKDSGTRIEESIDQIDTFVDTIQETLVTEWLARAFLHVKKELSGITPLEEKEEEKEKDSLLPYVNEPEPASKSSYKVETYPTTLYKYMVDYCKSIFLFQQALVPELSVPIESEIHELVQTTPFFSTQPATANSSKKPVEANESKSKPVDSLLSEESGYASSSESSSGSTFMAIDSDHRPVNPHQAQIQNTQSMNADIITNSYISDSDSQLTHGPINQFTNKPPSASVPAPASAPAPASVPASASSLLFEEKLPPLTEELPPQRKEEILYVQQKYMQYMSALMKAKAGAYTEQLRLYLTIFSSFNHPRNRTTMIFCEIRNGVIPIDYILSCVDFTPEDRVKLAILPSTFLDESLLSSIEKLPLPSEDIRQDTYFTTLPDDLLERIHKKYSSLSLTHRNTSLLHPFFSTLSDINS
jgi:hypothetical protein